MTTSEGYGTLLSACGVICSACPAYHAGAKGKTYQEQVVEAWHRIYGLDEAYEHINCGGCLGLDDDLFYTSRNCKARRCCKTRGFNSCADCLVTDCHDLEQAQTVWDEVPSLINKLSDADFETYARPYCDHRKRLEDTRRNVPE